MGADADRIKRKSPRVMVRKLEAGQATIKALQQATQLTDAELPAVLNKLCTALKFSPEHVQDTLQAVATVLGLPPGSAKFREVLLTLNERLFDHKPSTMVPRVTYFCKQYGMGGSTAQRALRQGVSSFSEATMQLRATNLQITLGWDDLQLKKRLSIHPQLLTRQPSTIAVNMKDLQRLGFSAAQALHMCASQPALLLPKWASVSCAEKLQVLTLLLGLTLDNVAPSWTYSVTDRLGPRVWFLFQSGVLDTPKALLSSGHFNNIRSRTNADFSKIYSRILSRPSMVYDTAYIEQWQQRWQFLRQHMKLSVKDIAAHQALLCASLHDTLAPRWHFFTLLAANQPGFKATDHLTAIATLSDQELAQVYDIDSLNITYGKFFRQQGHDE